VLFYFAAHEDDWQLFMNPSAFEDVSGAASKTVYIHITAGDDGLGAGSGGRKHPYYLARENGALAAIRLSPANIAANLRSTRSSAISIVPSYRLAAEIYCQCSGCPHNQQCPLL